MFLEVGIFEISIFIKELEDVEIVIFIIFLVFVGLYNFGALFM